MVQVPQSLSSCLISLANLSLIPVMLNGDAIGESYELRAHPAYLVTVHNLARANYNEEARKVHLKFQVPGR